MTQAHTESRIDCVGAMTDYVLENLVFGDQIVRAEGTEDSIRLILADGAEYAIAVKQTVEHPEMIEISFPDTYEGVFEDALYMTENESVQEWLRKCAEASSSGGALDIEPDMLAKIARTVRKVAQDAWKNASMDGGLTVDREALGMLARATAVLEYLSGYLDGSESGFSLY